MVVRSACRGSRFTERHREVVPLTAWPGGLNLPHAGDQLGALGRGQSGSSVVAHGSFVRLDRISTTRSNRTQGPVHYMSNPDADQQRCGPRDYVHMTTPERLNNALRTRNLVNANLLRGLLLPIH